MSARARGRGRRVLVTSAQERFALAAARGLARAGYRVGAVADQTPAPTHWSRACAERHLLVDAKADPDAFVNGLAAIVGRTPHAALLPGTDAALLAVSAGRERLEPHVGLGLPAHDVVVTAMDKTALGDAAAAAGLAAPRTIVCHTPEEGRAAAAELGLPLVVKPRSTAPGPGAPSNLRASVRVDDEADLARLAPRFGTPFLAQRLQPGPAYSAAGVATPDDGVVAFAVARYVRTWPPQAGNVAYAETIVPPDGLRERVGALLARLGWFGIFELELIRSGPQGFHAIDLNPRLYGSLALATGAGAPLATIFVDWILGEGARRVTARPGVGYRWEDADARNLAAALRAGRLGDALAIARPRRHVVHAHLDVHDPLPFAARAVLLARGRWGSG